MAHELTGGESESSFIDTSKMGTMSVEVSSLPPSLSHQEKVNEENYAKSDSSVPFDAILIMSLCFFSTVMNLRVFYVVINVPRNKLRPVSILVAHLSSVTIYYSIIAVFYVVRRWALVNFSRPGICELLSFIGNTVYAVFPLNVVGIIYESVKPSRVPIRKLFILKIISLIWLLAGGTCIPSIFMVEYEKGLFGQDGKCKKIPFLDDFLPTLVYEILRFSFFHLIISGYMIYAMFEIRYKIRYLYILKPIPSSRIRKKVQRVRYVYAHSIVFILLWLPSGVFVSIHKVFTRSDFEIPSFVLSLRGLIPITVLFFVLSPLIYVGFIEDISALHFCLGRCISSKICGEGNGRSPGGQNENAQNCSDNPGGGCSSLIQGPRVMEEMSRISTIAATATWEQQASFTSAADVSREPIKRGCNPQVSVPGSEEPLKNVQETSV